MKLDNNKLSEDIGWLLKDMSLRQLSAKTKISPSTLSRVHNGAMPELITYARLCKYMKMPLDKYIK